MRHKNESIEVCTYSWIVNEDTEEYEARVKLEYTTENDKTVSVWKQCDSEPEPSDHWNLMCEAMDDIAETVGLDKYDKSDTGTEQETDE
jgi:hypothetical protein